MTNSQIKKEILKQSKYLNDFEVNLYLYEGQGSTYDEAIWLDLCVENENNSIPIDLNDDELKDTEDNKNYLKCQQSKLLKYLSKFFKTNVIESCV